jgi:hypothetical protein
MTTPTLDDYVAAHLAAMRAPLRERTVSTVAGCSVVRSAGERVLLGPRGERIRVIEDVDGGTQVEHGDHLHAVVRPRLLSIRSVTRS